MRQIERITSRDNARLTYARKVRDGRDREQIFIEGRRSAAEALRSRLEITDGFIVEGFEDDGLLDLLPGELVLAELPGKIFKTLADTKQPQGIILLANRPRAGMDEIAEALRSSLLPVVLVLVEVNNPSNLGAVLRTAEAAGVAGVVVTSGSADVYSPKALRAAMGSAFRVCVWPDAEWVDVCEWARKHGMRSTAADLSAVVSYADIDWDLPRLVVFGSEARGLDNEILRIVDELIIIPMAADVESLNLAVSAGIICFEARRQRG